MVRSLYVRLLTILAVVALGWSATVFANHSWGGYHWARTANPFTLKTGDNVSSIWDGHLDLAISDWSQSSVLDLAEVIGGTRPRNCRATAGRVEVCSERYGKTGWLGIAQIWVSGSHITQGVVKVNDTYHNSPPYNTPAWRQFVVCQEIGHTLGLTHQDEDFGNANLGTCMDYGDPTNDSAQEHPNAHDFEQLEAIYAHLDNSTTVGAQLPSSTPPAMGQIDFDAPGQWGRLVRSNRDGRVQEYELDFGRGHKVLTHVFWADAR